MNSDEDPEHERETPNKAVWSVFGEHGGQIGPVMVSTDRTVLRATATILGAVAIYGSAGWLTLSTPVLTGGGQWAAIGLFAALAAGTIHTTLIEVYSAGIRTAIEHNQPTQNEDEADAR